jgi:hypothetical protein
MTDHICKTTIPQRAECVQGLELYTTLYAAFGAVARNELLRDCAVVLGKDTTQ